MVGRIVIWLVFCLLSVSAASAASFDCGKASTSFEKAICGDDKLSASDETLAVAYQTAIGGLTDEAAARMKASQKSWLELAMNACVKNGQPADAAYDEDGLYCLNDVFTRRIGMLENSRMIGGLRFYNGEAFVYAPDTEGGEFVPVSTKMVSAPQLDGDTELALEFNAAIEHAVENLSTTIAAGPGSADFDAESDDWNTMRVTGVSETRITVEEVYYQYPHGAAHGSYGVSYLHFLRDEKRTLVADDIFKGDTWKAKLADLAFAALKTNLGEYIQVESVSDIADMVTEPARWSFNRTGLEITFQPYEVASYADGTPTVTIPWLAFEGDLTDNAGTITAN